MKTKLEFKIYKKEPVYTGDSGDLEEDLKNNKFRGSFFYGQGIVKSENQKLEFYDEFLFVNLENLLNMAENVLKNEETNLNFLGNFNFRWYIKPDKEKVIINLIENGKQEPKEEASFDKVEFIEATIQAGEELIGYLLSVNPNLKTNIEIKRFIDSLEKAKKALREAQKYE